jgi:hypothetical protein
MAHAIVHAPIAVAAQVAQQTNPLAPYTTFDAAVQRGPHAGLVLSGPIVLGQTDAHGQVIGFLFQNGGPRLTVVGGIFGRRVSLRLVLHNGGAIEISGVGQLKRVTGGLPGGMALVGSGIISGPAKNDVGAWFTVKPTTST